MAQFVANPRTSFSIVTTNSDIGPENQRCLLIGQKTSGGSATAGALVTDVPRTDAEINALFGSGSHLAMIARAYRSVNTRTNVDALPLADNGSGTAATASVAFSGTATGAGKLYVTIVSKELHTYELDVNTGDAAATLGTNLLAAINADRYLPFTAALSTATVTCTAASKGTHANDWLLSYKGTVPGITVTLTGWTSGATNPALTTLFDPIGVIRYQSIVWPACYDVTKIQVFLDARKNVNNNIMDGMAFTYQNLPFSSIKTLASTTNSSEVVLFNNEPTSSSTWIGPHIPEAPDCIAAKIAAAFDLRLEPGAVISPEVVTNAPLDQFGGPHTHSLPLFNTPLIGVGMPMKGTGYTDDEQVELMGAGVSVVGANREWNAVITSQVVTTWLNDAAGNPDKTWQYAEWRRTHGAIREYFQINCQKKFRQSRLTAGLAVAGYDITDQAAVQAYLKQLYIELTQLCLTVDGIDARTFFERNTTVTLSPATRTVSVASIVPMVSQLGVINGVVQYTFSTN